MLQVGPGGSSSFHMLPARSSFYYARLFWRRTPQIFGAIMNLKPSGIMFDNKLAIIKLLFCFSVCFLTRPIWLIVLLDISTLSKQEKKSKQVSLTYPAGTEKRFKNVASTLVFTLCKRFWSVIFRKFI